MREILFRGQTRRYGEKVYMNGEKVKSNWVYGGIFPQNKGGDFAIIYQQEPTIKKYTVYADTVGQYTGLKDKNGNKIFEGDIIRCTLKSEEIDMLAVVKYGKYIDADSLDDSAYLGWYLDIKNKCVSILSGENDGLEFEIIGNIHDNPELLEE